MNLSWVGNLFLWFIAGFAGFLVLFGLSAILYGIFLRRKMKKILMHLIMESDEERKRISIDAIKKANYIR